MTDSFSTKPVTESGTAALKGVQVRGDQDMTDTSPPEKRVKDCHTWIHDTAQTRGRCYMLFGGGVVVFGLFRGNPILMMLGLVAAAFGNLVAHNP